MKTSEMFPQKEWFAPSFEDVNAAALNAYPNLLQSWFPAGRVQGHEFVVGNVNGDAGDSLSVNVKTGVWSDFGNKGDGGSDPVSLYAARYQIGQGEACNRLAGELGLSTNNSTQARTPKAQPRSEWKPILPALSPPPHHPHHSRLGQPSQVWQYNNRDGQLLFLVCRFDRGDGGKDIVPFSYGVLDGKEGWHWKAIPDQRPLYGLDRLQASPQAKVLLVEGEKTADAAQRLLPSLVAVTWPGGGKAAGKTDWSPLKGREVVVWPDADKPGRETAEGWLAPHGEFKRGLVHYLSDAGGVVRVVEPPPNVKDGWDLADAEVEGWDTERVVKWIRENMREASQPSEPEAVEIDNTWPEPEWSLVGEFRAAPPSFPLECLGEFWADWLEQQAKAKSIPVDFVSGSLLATAASVIGNARWVSPWPEWSEPCILWIGLVGPPSSGKSPGMDAPLALIRKIEDEMSARYPDTLHEWEGKREFAKAKEEAWKGEIKQAVKRDVAPPDKPTSAVIPDKPKRPRIRVMDPSIEALGVLLAQMARGLLFHRDEMAGWIGNFDRYGGNGGDRPFWVEAFGGRAYVIDRVKHDEPIQIPHLSVSILGGIQPDRLRALLTTGDDDGLSSRFLFLWPHSVPPQPPSGIVDNRGALGAFNRLHGLRMSEDDNGNPAPLAIRLSDEAARVFQAWRLENYTRESDATGLYASHVGKLPGLLLRIALIIEYLRWSAVGGPEPEKIGTEATGYAAHLIDEYFKPMAVRVYGDAALPEDEAHAIAIARRIRKERHRTINVRQIRRTWCLPGLKAPEKVMAAIRVLEEGGWTRPAPSRQGQTPGRQSSDYEVNPRILETRE